MGKRDLRTVVRTLRGPSEFEGGEDLHGREGER
jgi:hypothetical protein